MIRILFHQYWHEQSILFHGVGAQMHFHHKLPKILYLRYQQSLSGFLLQSVCIHLENLHDGWCQSSQCYYRLLGTKLLDQLFLMEAKTQKVSVSFLAPVLWLRFYQGFLVPWTRICLLRCSSLLVVCLITFHRSKPLCLTISARETQSHYSAL